MNNIFTLKQWIVIATKNLTPTAISSITREITDHYQTSLEKYEARGILSLEAQELALQDLGNPEKSAKKFVQVYLTRDEEKKLKTMTESRYLTSTIVGMVLNGITNFIPLFMIFGAILNDNVDFLLSIWSITFTFMSLALTLLHFFDLIIIKNLRNKNIIFFLTKTKLTIIILSFISVSLNLITYLNIWGFKNNFYIVPTILTIFAVRWLKNIYPVLRKFSNTPQRTPST